MQSTAFRFTVAVLVFAAVISPAFAQEIRNWPAPLLWSPPEKSKVGQPTDELEAQGVIELARPLAFVAITPCRLVDTRPASAFPIGYGAPALVANATRDFDLNSAAHCPGIPADVGAYSLNVTVTETLGPGDIRIWPTGDFALVSTQNWAAAGVSLANAAIVPAGTNGAVTVQTAGSGTHLIIDINGYYGGNFPDLTRSVHIPLLSFIGCSGTPAFLDMTSGADASPDFDYLLFDGGIRIVFDHDAIPDQGSRICSEFLVPTDYVSGGHFRVAADKAGHAGASEILNCAAGVDMNAMEPAGTVEIDSASTVQYVCSPGPLPLTPGRRVHFGLSITSSETMDNTVVLLGVVFEYTASQ